MVTSAEDVIAAVATAQGRAGIGVIRVSGLGLQSLAATLTRDPAKLIPRVATLRTFYDGQAQVIDAGLLIFFSAPNSYTGEEVLEIQAHGGVGVMQLLLQRCLESGARIAHPGEFTQRAFLNQKLDLVQAEAVADLIAAESTAAVLGAARSLKGAFSTAIHSIVEELIELRVRAEGSLDFSDDGLDLTDVCPFQTAITAMRQSLQRLIHEGKQGVLLRSGSTVVLIGAPNVGKSSLLNQLCDADHALVTPQAGTTRDPVRATLWLDGVPIHMVDTAGIRTASDLLEQAGIERTWREIDQADHALVIVDASTGLTSEDQALLQKLPAHIQVHLVVNKIDLGSGRKQQAWVHHCRELSRSPVLARVSAKSGEGIELLKRSLLQVVGWQMHSPAFMARERHLEALNRANAALGIAQGQEDLVLLAEELRITQFELGAITGAFSSDQLLGEIFSRFCIGK